MATTLTPSNFTNPAGWPDEILPIIQRAVTTEFASQTRRGVPITFPLTPYIGEDGRSLDASTGLTYPAKAERARRNPQVALLYSDPVGSGLNDPPVVLVQGLAAVRDADIQATTDRYLRLSLARFPEAYNGMPKFFMRRIGWYFARIWIEVTPLRILWWPSGRTDEAPQVWQAPVGTIGRPSDPAPPGKQPAPWKESPGDWRAAADRAVALGAPVLTTVGGDGFPLAGRARGVAIAPEGFWLTIPPGLPEALRGPACLTFHTHPEVFTGQENHLFVGEAVPDDAGVFFRVERQVADWSLAGSGLQLGWSFLSSGLKLAPRLKAEAARRGQPVPKVNLPDDR